MRYMLGVLMGTVLMLSLPSGAFAQDLGGSYPPAEGEMIYNPPLLPHPAAVGGQYVETFPTYPGVVEPNVTAPNPVAAAPAVTKNQAAKGPIARARARQAQRGRAGTRVYNNQVATPYPARMPQGQLYWPDASAVPGYSPASRYQTFGQGYEQSPYGSNFYGGYWKGWPRQVPMIGD